MGKKTSIGQMVQRIRYLEILGRTKEKLFLLNLGHAEVTDQYKHTSVGIQNAPVDTPRKTNMTTKKQPFKDVSDVSPIKNGDFQPVMFVLGRVFSAKIGMPVPPRMLGSSGVLPISSASMKTGKPHGGSERHPWDKKCIYKPISPSPYSKFMSPTSYHFERGP